MHRDCAIQCSQSFQSSTEAESYHMWEVVHCEPAGTVQCDGHGRHLGNSSRGPNLKIRTSFAGRDVPGRREVATRAMLVRGCTRG